jgi:hypothetical protein
LGKSNNENRSKIIEGFSEVIAQLQSLWSDDLVFSTLRLGFFADKVTSPPHVVLTHLGGWLLH